MGNFLFVVNLTVLILANYIAIGQPEEKKYKIISLEGKTTEISVIDRLDGGIWIKHNNDSKSYVRDNQYGITEVKLLSRNLLEILYGSSGGSGLHNTSIVLVCIKNDKPHIAMTMLVESLYDDSCGLLKAKSLYDERFRLLYDVWAGIYIVDMKTVGTIDSNNFHLDLTIRDASKSSNEPKKYWHDRRIKTTLHFDSHKGIFFNNRKYLDGTFSIYHQNTHGKSQQFFHGIYPAIDIKTLPTIYFINENWYEKNVKFT